MKLQRISIVQDFPQPVAKIFNWLGDHNTLGQIFFPFKVTRIRDGQEYLNGVGSVRKLSAFPLPPVEETVTVRFEPHNGGTRLHYTIVFRGALPLLGPVVKVGLAQGIKMGLKKLARKSL